MYMYTYTYTNIYTSKIYTSIHVAYKIRMYTEMCKCKNRHVYTQTHKLILRNIHIHMESCAHNKYICMHMHTNIHPHACIPKFEILMCAHSIPS